MRAQLVSPRSVPLAPSEPGECAIRRSIMWGYNRAIDSRTVDVHVCWLSQKIEDDPDNPQLILTVRGVGYRFKE